MNAYSIALFVFGVLLVTHPAPWRWLINLYTDARDFLQSVEEE